MSPSFTQSRKLVISLMLCSFGVLVASPVPASTCPPGSHGSAPHCQPSQAHPHTSSATATAAGKSHASPVTQPSARRSLGLSVREPVAHHASAAQTRGIIFVGGKNAINSQPVPPGRAVHQTPRPGAPVEHANKRRLEQPERSHR